MSTSLLAAGTHSITAVYSGDGTHTGSTSGTLTQTVNPAGQGSFSMSAVPASKTAPQNSTQTFAISVTRLDGFAGNVSLSVSGAPPQSGASFAPNPVTAGSTSSTLTVVLGKNTPKKTFTLTISGVSGSLNATTKVTITVQ